MVSQYPHFLFTLSKPAASVQDANGRWISAPPAWVLHSQCREETNGKGAEIIGQDGKAFKFSSTVYIPKGTAGITEGTPVLVSETGSAEGKKRVSGACQKFDNGQRNCRLWV